MCRVERGIVDDGLSSLDCLMGKRLQWRMMSSVVLIETGVVFVALGSNWVGVGWCEVADEQVMH